MTEEITSCMDDFRVKQKKQWSLRSRAHTHHALSLELMAQADEEDHPESAQQAYDLAKSYRALAADARAYGNSI
jgi:hypothetical protein